MKKYRSKKGAEKLSLALIYTVLTIISVIWLLPFLMLIILSFRGEQAGMSADYLFPRQWSFDNYIKLFTETKFLNWYDENEDLKRKGPANIFNKIIEENFPNLKKEMP